MNFRWAKASETKSRAVASLASFPAPSREGSSATASYSTEGPPSTFCCASMWLPWLSCTPPTVGATTSNIAPSCSAALEQEGAMFEVVAPTVGGVQDSQGNHIEAQQKVDGGPSVLYDAVALLPSRDGAGKLAKDATARDFVSDAFAHLKFIGYVTDAMPLIEKAGLAGDLDEGWIAFSDGATPASFVEQCRNLRLWSREEAVDQT